MACRMRAVNGRTSRLRLCFRIQAALWLPVLCILLRLSRPVSCRLGSRHCALRRFDCHHASHGSCASCRRRDRPQPAVRAAPHTSRLCPALVCAECRQQIRTVACSVVVLAAAR
eukprot:Amastigsp_a344313_26.p2 type:complete len:114 gc:universal Amastigsp_a344313_26:234-575(+)